MFSLGIVGALMHTVEWVTSTSGDLFLPNPNFRLEDWEGSSCETGIGLYCVHGTADRNGSFRNIANQISASLPDSISSIHLVCFEGWGLGIAALAQQLLTKIKANNHREVILMGHSRGGLLITYLAEYLARAAGITVHAIFTMGTPFGGAVVPGMDLLSMVSKSVEEMKPGSSFLNDLISKILLSNIRYIHFAAQYDGLVAVKETYVNSIPIVLRGHNHLSMMQNAKEMVTIIKHRLHDVCPARLMRPMALKRCEEAQVKNSKEKIRKEKFEFIEAEGDRNLTRLCYDLDCQIQELRSTRNIRSAEPKFKILTHLRKLFNDMLQSEQRGQYYPEAKTIDQFINDFMGDTKIERNTTPRAILSQQRNPLTAFGNTKTTSERFIQDLLVKYKNVSLPQPPQAEFIGPSTPRKAFT